MYITSYEGICNLGNNMESVYQKALNGDNSCFCELKDYIKSNPIRAGLINCRLPVIKNKDYKTRCNELVLKTLELINTEIEKLIKKYDKSEIGIIVATTNSGVEEYENTNNENLFELGNPARFLQKHLGLSGFQATVSTACSSGIKAFSLARDLMDKNIVKSVILVSVDTLAKVPVYGFNSLEVLTDKPSVPFSKNRSGMNIGEACAIFILEKTGDGIEIAGIGENSDTYHPTTPDPSGIEGMNCIKLALDEASLKPENIDYVNAHGTGTLANDIMEANAIYKIFGNMVPVSSTKPLTGHCLGAAAGIETALCCKLLEKNKGYLYPHIYDGEFDHELPKIQLAQKDKIYRCKTVMCNSFGFGGTNAIMILKRADN